MLVTTVELVERLFAQPFYAYFPPTGNSHIGRYGDTHKTLAPLCRDDGNLIFRLSSSATRHVTSGTS